MEIMNTSESWWDSLVDFATNNAVAFWVIVAAVVVALIVIIALIVGTKRKKSKTVSFGTDESDEPKELTQQQKSGNYQATGGFNFAPGGAGEKEPVAKPAPEVQPEPEPLVDPEQEAKAEPEPETKPEPAAGPADQVQPLSPEASEPETTEPAETERSEAEPEEPVSGEPETEQDETEQVEPEQAPATEQASQDVVEAPAEQPEPAAESVPQPQEEIAPATGRLSKLRGRLSKSQNAIGQGVLGLLTAGDLDEDAWEEIEDTLIMADLGTNATMKVTELLREKITERGVSSEAEARAMLREALIEVGKPEMDRSIKAMPHDGKPAVAMIVGVNGTGKTTTTGKLGRVLVAMGHNVVFGAADTFRAAAADQLETWGRRVGATTVRGAEGADPASVAFDAVATGVNEGVDVVLVDTAGRLHTSNNLMDQLGKVKRVIEKKAAVDEVLLVIDATVGQNGLSQARIFREVVDISGVVLTKLDGTAKGGIVFQVQEELGVPVKLVGLGEGADDLAPFEIESFVDALLGNEH